MTALAHNKTLCAEKARDIAATANQLATHAAGPWTVDDLTTFHDKVVLLREKVIDLTTRSRYLRKLASMSTNNLQKCIQLADINGIIAEVFASTWDLHPAINEVNMHRSIRDYGQIYVKWSLVYPKYAAYPDDLTDSLGHRVGSAPAHNGEVRDEESAVVCVHKVHQLCRGLGCEELEDQIIKELANRPDSFLAPKHKYAGAIKWHEITGQCCTDINDF